MNLHDNFSQASSQPQMVLSFLNLLARTAEELINNGDEKKVRIKLEPAIAGSLLPGARLYIKEEYPAQTFYLNPVQKHNHASVMYCIDTDTNDVENITFRREYRRGRTFSFMTPSRTVPQDVFVNYIAADINAVNTRTLSTTSYKNPVPDYCGPK